MDLLFSVLGLLEEYHGKLGPGLGSWGHWKTEEQQEGKLPVKICKQLGILQCGPCMHGPAVLDAKTRI